MRLGAHGRATPPDFHIITHRQPLTIALSKPTSDL
jgi:hypothetical protein